MLLEIGVGDAYGACFEGTSLEFIEDHNLLEYELHPRKRRRYKKTDLMPSGIPTGHYTDDTQMSLAIVEAMLDDSEPWTTESIANRFVECFHRDERRGYTVAFFNILLNSKDGAEMISKIHGKSVKSGAAMRSGPLGLIADLNEMTDKVTLQAKITHDSWLGRNSAVGAAMMTHYFYYNLGPRHELCGWMRDAGFGDLLHSPHAFEADGEKVECWSPGRRVRCHGWDCLEAAIYAIEEHASLSKILEQCVAYGGDTDTVAAIAMSAASCARDIEQDMPMGLVQKLENSKFGRDYLLDLDLKLLAKFQGTSSWHS